MSATRPMNNVIGVTKTTRVRRPRTSSTKGSFGAADRFAPLPQREAYRGAVELGFPEKLQRLDTPGATWSPRRSDEWGARVAPELTRPRFQPLISPRSGEPRPSQGSPFIKNARLTDFWISDERSAFSGAAGSLEEGRAPLERRRGVDDEPRAAPRPTSRPCGPSASARPRSASARRSARDVLRLYHRDPYARSYPTIAIDGDDRPCTAPDAILDFVVHELHVERPSLSRAGSRLARAGARLNEMIGIEAGDPVKFVALRGGEDRLRREAARVGFSMLLDPARLAALAADRGVAVGGLFAGPDRVRLLASILAAPEAEGCYLPLAAAVRDAAVVDYFPLVSALSLARLRERLPRRYVPFVREADHGAIRDVWGEHVALYFAFHSFQTRQLCFLAPTGLLCYGAATALKARGFYKFAAAIDVGFSIVVALWTIKFTRLWRRREAELALEFGTAGFTNKQRNRPQFAAHPGVVQRRSLVDGRAKFYFPERLANAKKRGAAAVIAVVLSLVTAIIVVLFWIRSF
ncbi:intracellular chloride channel [Aureococcus anophagefferens]|nr:intracellular chloride channel [Aureococcus anophagefferens]